VGGPGTAGTGASGILGRSDELAALRLALAATPGQGSTLVLRGEPGVGRSGLLDDVARQSREAG
jgi:hypothetical protein